MADVLYTAPTSEPLTLDEAKEHLRVDGTDEDMLISSLILAAREYCENYLNKALITQTRELWLDDWPDEDYIKLKGPLVSVTSIKYYDTDDTETTFASTYYFVDTKSKPGRVGLNYSEIWPTTTLRPFNGVVVRYVCGYGDFDDVPQIVKNAMLLIIGHLFENREASIDKALSEIPLGVKSLLGIDRVWPV